MANASLVDYAHIPPAAPERIRAIVASHRTLADVVSWGRTQAPPRLVSEIVTQDEYTHDVIVPVDDGLVLVYDTT